jgi:hypothetical protein
MAAEASVLTTEASVLTTKEFQKVDKQLSKKLIEYKSQRFIKGKLRGSRIYGEGTIELILWNFCDGMIAYHLENKNPGIDCSISNFILLTKEEYNNPENWEPTEWELKKIAK